MRFPRFLLALSVAVIVATLVVIATSGKAQVAPAKAAPAKDDVATTAVAVLNKYCIACHGPDVQKNGLRLDSAAGFAAGGENGKLVGETPETSLLWTKVIGDSEMPPADKPQPTSEEKAVLAAWLKAGAKWPGGDVALAEQAHAVFRKHCYACHGRQRYETKGLDFAHYDSLIAPRAKELKSFLVAGDIANSRIWERINTGTMPPKDKDRLTEEEQTTVREWISAGAPRWPEQVKSRTYATELDSQNAIVAHLRKLNQSARPHQRYFTFANLHNNPFISDDELAIAKAALAKLLNSLSWEREIVIPQPIDEQQTLFAVDLRDLDWTDQDHWSKLFENTGEGKPGETHIGYPYGLGYLEADLRNLSDEINTLSGSSLARLRVRGDWFVAKAACPPLYHQLLELPDNADDLERQLEVDTVADWTTPNLMRGAVKRSGVSQSNRLLDRHRSLHGAYWVSYDFKQSTGKANLATHPLGPVFQGNPLESFAFVHDGGEIVFSLPNGLQGYLLVDGQNRRINSGPIQIVSDPNKFSGTPDVVNGISCIGCHKHGMIRFTDEIYRAFQVKNPAAIDKLRDLFTRPEKLDERLKKDEERFLTALLEAVQPFLPVTSTADLRDFLYEPVGETALRYRADLTLADVAAELDYPQDELLAAIKANANVKLRIGSLLEKGGVVKREEWENRTLGSNSMFQDVATALQDVIASD